MAFLDWPSQDPLLVRHKSADSTNDSLGFLFVPMTRLAISESLLKRPTLLPG